MDKRGSSLHNHTYKGSLLDATISPEQLVQQAYDLGYNAVAVTEHGTMFSFIDAYKKAKEIGVKFIAGCEVYETLDMDYKEPNSNRYHLILLAKSNKGLENLFKIVTEGYTRGFYGKPRVDLALLNKYSEDIICLSSCLASRLSRALVKARCNCCDDSVVECLNAEPDWEEAERTLEEYKIVFGDNFYIELQSHSTDAQALANKRLLELALKTDTKFTVTFDTHMLDGSDKMMDIHKKFLFIGADREVGETYEGCYQQSWDEVHQRLDVQIGYEYVEQAIATTDYIAEQCNVDIELHQDLMPHIQIPKQFKTEQDYLKYLVRQGWKQRRLSKRLSKAEQEIYRKRLEEEFEILDYLGYCSYFIMLKQIIDKVKDRKIPLGYSRGSGGNVLTLYVLGVTEVDSIKWELDFSRFANKGRKGSPADYDMDISKRRRQEVIDISIELFGRENVAQVATFNSLSPKVCIRDLGKVFHNEGTYHLPNYIRDKIAKLIPDDPNKGMTIERAMEINPELQKYEEQYPLLFEYTKHLQNLPKSVGCHASAVLITPKPVIDFCPLMLNKDGNLMSQLEMHNAMEDIGMVKMDFLGLKTVDVVDDTIRLAGITWDDIDVNTMNLDDKDVLRDIYGKGRTLGIFQMEKKTCQDMFSEMGDVSVNDIIAVNAMNRPAILSVGMHNVYIHNKHRPEDVKYIHMALAPIFGETNGIMLYQEQALKVFRLAGFPEDETDTARRAIGKKKEDVMKALYAKFDAGLKAQGWSADQVLELWKLVEAQAEYSFNKGHSCAYGLLSYVTGYLKYHYPVEFMTALLINEIGNYEETTKYINEARDMGIDVLPPDINISGKTYTNHDGKILFGLSIKGIGEGVIDQIIEERNNGMFKSMADFYNRVNPDTAKMVALIKSGAFGTNKDDILLQFAKLTFSVREFKPLKTMPTKKILMELGIMTEEQYKNKDLRLELYNKYKAKLFKQEQVARYEKHINEFKSKYMKDPDMYEFETLSIFLDGHPIDSYLEYFPSPEEAEDGDLWMLGGTISRIQNKKSQYGGKYAFIDILTPYGIIECTVFSQQFNEHQELLKKGTNVVVRVKKSEKGFNVQKMRTLESWIQWAKSKEMVA